MISVIQRCSKAKVDINNKTVGEIGHGMVVLLGIQKDDSKEDADYLVKKLSTLRMFNDSDNKMNLSIKDVKGSALVISQFTLCGDTNVEVEELPSCIRDPAAPVQDWSTTDQVFLNPNISTN